MVNTSVQVKICQCFKLPQAKSEYLSISKSTNPTPNNIPTEYFWIYWHILRLQDAKKLDCAFWFPEYVPVKADSRTKPEYSWIQHIPTSFLGMPLLAEQDWGPQSKFSVCQNPRYKPDWAIDSTVLSLIAAAATTAASKKTLLESIPITQTLATQLIVPIEASL